MTFLDYHRTVIGYHGTSDEVADRLVAGEPFTPSESINEWLGSGVYFWEYAPKQALWWAKKLKRHANPAVVGAMIRLGNCFDLLDSQNVGVRRIAKDGMIKQMKRERIEIPENRRIYKNLDCAVFNYFYQKVEDEGGAAIDCARAANILAFWHARPDRGYGKVRR
jgi:hypothetical protein